MRNQGLQESACRARAGRRLQHPLASGKRALLTSANARTPSSICVWRVRDSSGGGHETRARAGSKEAAASIARRRTPADASRIPASTTPTASSRIQCHPGVWACSASGASPQPSSLLPPAPRDCSRDPDGFRGDGGAPAARPDENAPPSSASSRWAPGAATLQGLLARAAPAAQSSGHGCGGGSSISRPCAR
jgi:hypothetical protein